MRTIDQIIEDAGGRQALGERTGLKDGVRKWPQIGIPERYWPSLLSDVPDLTVEELFQANLVARGVTALPPQQGVA